MKTMSKLHQRLRLMPGVAWLDDYTDTPLGFLAGLLVGAVLGMGVIVAAADLAVYRALPAAATDAAASTNRFPPHGATELPPNTTTNTTNTTTLNP